MIDQRELTNLAAGPTAPAPAPTAPAVPPSVPTGSLADIIADLPSGGAAPAPGDIVRGPGLASDDPRVKAAVAGLEQHAPVKPLLPGELKWRLTVVLYPSILLVFVALYVSSLASNIEPEMALLRAGGAGLVLAVLARVAVGILGDEKRLVLNDSQIVAMARSGAVRDKLSEVSGASALAATEQPSVAAQAAGVGGKE
jgi:hypothetical protein